MHYLSIVGLLLDIFGAWLVAYEILWGYPKKNRRDIAQTKLDNMRDFIEKYRPSSKNMPSPPYNESEINSAAAEFNEQWAPKVKKLEDEVDIFELKHPEFSFWCAFWGIILLTIGFSLQIIGGLSGDNA